MAYGGGNITFSNHSEGTANGSAASVFDYCHSLYLHSRILVPLLHAVATTAGLSINLYMMLVLFRDSTQALDRSDQPPPVSSHPQHTLIACARRMTAVDLSAFSSGFTWSAFLCSVSEAGGAGRALLVAGPLSGEALRAAASAGSPPAATLGPSPPSAPAAEPVAERFLVSLTRRTRPLIFFSSPYRAGEPAPVGFVIFTRHGMKSKNSVCLKVARGTLHPHARRHSSTSGSYLSGAAGEAAFLDVRLEYMAVSHGRCSRPSVRGVDEPVGGAALAVTLIHTTGDPTDEAER
ncbi:hypothetical protein Q5P01_001019 [Channa striata]|uniref:Uncharacterized protein n=1 Tax=Channa striata TaxID=64152 RepID=A0AA88LEZ9_CHASR|nr:hypothetical protein Q5P01_001019 [Channa striata]